MHHPRTLAERPRSGDGRRLLFLTLSILFFAIPVLCVRPAAAYEPVPALIDLRTTFSDGAYDPDTLVQMALKKGFGVVIFNDHDRMATEYGLPPFRNIVKKPESSPNRCWMERT